MIEVDVPLSPYINIMLRLVRMAGEEETPELYAKVIRPIDTSSKHYLVHFTSVPPGIQAQLRGLADEAGPESPDPRFYPQD